MAPLVIGIFFFSAVQLFFIGILGEYIGAIHTQVLKRPLVIEKERINFENRFPLASAAGNDPGIALPSPHWQRKNPSLEARSASEGDGTGHRSGCH